MQIHKKCLFIGHKKINITDTLVNRLTILIEKLIVIHNVTMSLFNNIILSYLIKNLPYTKEGGNDCCQRLYVANYFNFFIKSKIVCFPSAERLLYKFKTSLSSIIIGQKNSDVDTFKISRISKNISRVNCISPLSIL